MAGRTVLAIVLVLIIIFVVPFVVYSAFALVTGLEPAAEGSPLRFLLGIFVFKLGTRTGNADGRLPRKGY